VSDAAVRLEQLVESPSVKEWNSALLLVLHWVSG
jgi:hypothetical protein